MYIYEEETNAINTIVNYYKAMPFVEAIVLVGSNASGNDDEYSDVDINVITEKESVNSVLKDAEKFFTKNFEYFKYYVQDNADFGVRKIGMLLKTGLELDITFVSRSIFVYKKNSFPDLPYSFLFAKEGFNKKFNLKKFSTNVLADLKNYSNNIWHEFKASIVALKRNQLFRAYKEVEIIKDCIVKIYCKQHKLNWRYYRNVDKLPPEIKAALEKTFVKNLSVKKIKTALIKELELFIALLTQNGLEKDAQDYKEFFKFYIKKLGI